MVYWRLLPPVGVGGDQPLVGVDQQHERHAEDQLHARTPEAVELVFEHAQSVLDELVASPTQANVQQVQAERAAYGLADVEMDHLGVTPGRHQAERHAGQVAVRVDQHDGWRELARRFR